MIKACDIKRGTVVDIDGGPHIAEKLHVQTPSARGGASLYKIRFRNVKTKQKVDKTVKGDESFQETNFQRREVQVMYSDQDSSTFMDLEDYSQFTLSNDVIGGERLYLSEDMEGLSALVADDQVIGLQLPSVVDLEVTECGPPMKGASATARTKPATLSTGLVVQVPEYLSTGEVIRVDTATGEFLSRA